ncbi:MAG TPA: DUF2782 domain-containing protein [Burkholderiales bacterium]|nr:DUF2782 domain-containing protein [Burkholderiales bacterium]
MRLIAAAVFCIALSAYAQSNRPKDLQPLPEPPPPPQPQIDQSLEPEVTIIKRGKETIEEYRVHGRLYMIKVTPASTGIPYYLIDENGTGKFSRRDDLDNPVKVPMWVILSF